MASRDNELGSILHRKFFLLAARVQSLQLEVPASSEVLKLIGARLPLGWNRRQFQIHARLSTSMCNAHRLSAVAQSGHSSMNASDDHWCDCQELLIPICPSRKVPVASRLQGLSEGVNVPGIKAREGTSAPFGNGPFSNFRMAGCSSDPSLTPKTVSLTRFV